MKEIRRDLIADITLYPTNQGGRLVPTATDSFGCPFKIRKDDNLVWDGRLLLDGTSMKPGETRRVGVAFLNCEDAAPIFRKAGKFYLWELRIIGEATVISN
jgi:hypothetical protein